MLSAVSTYLIRCARFRDYRHDITINSLAKAIASSANLARSLDATCDRFYEVTTVDNRTCLQSAVSGSSTPARTT
jgi:hypothetical protein